MRVYDPKEVVEEKDDDVVWHEISPLKGGPLIKNKAFRDWLLIILTCLLFAIAGFRWGLAYALHDASLWAQRACYYYETLPQDANGLNLTPFGMVNASSVDNASLPIYPGYKKWRLGYG